MDEKERYHRAKKRVKDLKDFYSHAGVYVLVIGALTVVNIATSPDSIWVMWPAIGWGIGLAIHAMTTFSPNFFGDEWEERKIRELMEKEHGGRKSKSDYYPEDESL